MVFALSTEEGILKKQLRLHEEFQLVRQIPMRGREQIYDKIDRLLPAPYAPCVDVSKSTF